MQPKVSVIIPVYNVEKYLRQCLDSVVNQTLKDIEIICIDDGSTDNSLNILKEYAQKDNRIKIISKKNGGLSSARNAGLKFATGEFVGFVDSDDYIERETYENAVEPLREEIMRKKKRWPFMYRRFLRNLVLMSGYGAVRK